MKKTINSLFSNFRATSFEYKQHSFSSPSLLFDLPLIYPQNLEKLNKFKQK